MGTNFTDFATTDNLNATTLNDRFDELDAAIEAFRGSAFSAHKNGTAQSIPHNTVTLIEFGTEVWDLGDDYDESVSRWIPSVAGIATVSATIQFSTTVDAQEIVLHVYKNGSSAGQFRAVANTVNAQSVQIVVDVQVNGTTDYIEIFVNHFFGSSQSINGTATRTWFTGRVTPATI